MSNSMLLKRNFFDNELNKLLFTDSQDNTEMSAEKYNRLAIESYRDGFFSKAISYYEKLLKIEKNSFKENVNTATIYGSLADIYFSKKDLFQASLFYAKALNIRIKLLGNNHLQTASSYHDLAYFYASEGEFERAQLLFEKAVSIRKKLLSKNSLDLARSYMHLGMCHYHLFNYQKSYDNLFEAVKIKERVLSDKDEKLFIARQNLNEVKKHIASSNKKGILSKFKNFFL